MSSLHPSAAASFMSFLEDKRISDSLRHHMRSCANGRVRADVTREHAEHKVGASRIGGDPDLPVGFQWPKGRGPNVSMVFLAQLALTELPRHEELPAEGHLLFFLDADEPAYNIRNCVCYFPAGMKLERRPFPDGATPAIEIEDGKNAFPSCQVDFAPDWDLDSNAMEEVADLNDEEQDLVDDLAKGCTHLLGTCESWSADPRIEAYLHANGMGELHFHTHQTRHDLPLGHDLSDDSLKKLDDFNARKGFHSNGAKKWILLFKLASETSANMCWWDAGYLQFLIHKDALAAQDFSGVYCDLATS